MNNQEALSKLLEAKKILNEVWEDKWKEWTQDKKKENIYHFLAVTKGHLTDCIVRLQYLNDKESSIGNKGGRKVENG